MKQVYLKQTIKEPSSRASAKDLSAVCNVAANSQEVPEQVRDDEEEWSYQGMRRDQVEGSYRIFAFCLLAGLIVALLALIVRA